MCAASGGSPGAEFVARYLCEEVGDPEHFLLFQARETPALEGVEPLLERTLSGTAAQIEHVVASARVERDRLGTWPAAQTALATA